MQGESRGASSGAVGRRPSPHGAMARPDGSAHVRRTFTPRRHARLTRWHASGSHTGQPDLAWGRRRRVVRNLGRPELLGRSRRRKALSSCPSRDWFEDCVSAPRPKEARMVTRVTTAGLATTILMVQLAEAGGPPGVVPAPPTLVLLTAAAGIVAVGSWWRSRRK